MQVYFIDNEEYFKRSDLLLDKNEKLKEENKKEYEDKIIKGLEFSSNYTQEKYANRLFEFICDC